MNTNTINVDDPHLRGNILKLLDHHLAPHMDPNQIQAVAGELFLMLDCAAHQPEPAWRVTDFLNACGDDDQVIASRGSSVLTVSDIQAVLDELDELREAAHTNHTGWGAA